MIVNCTPRVLRLYNEDRPDGIDDLDLALRQTINPEPQYARLSPLPTVTLYEDEIAISVLEYGHADHLPGPRDGVLYVVPLDVALALHPRRSDLLVVHDEVRSSDGIIIGCRSLAQPA